MICLKCGFDNPEHSQYCVNCGSSFAQMAKELRKAETAGKEVVSQQKKLRDAGDFTFPNRNTCKKCGTPYESAGRKHSYYLIRWIATAAIVGIAEWVFSAMIALAMIDAPDTETLNYILCTRIPGVVLALLHLRYLSPLIENLLGITRVMCPVCVHTGESVYYLRCLARYPFKANALTGKIDALRSKTHNHNVFRILGIGLVILNILSVTPRISMTIADKAIDLPYINLMICSAPAMIFFVLGMLCVNLGAQLAYIPVLHIRRIPAILSVTGAAMNLLSAMFMTKGAILENISRIVAIRGIELTQDLLQAPMGGVKFGIIVVNILIVVCSYFALHTEQLICTQRYTNKNYSQEV